MQLREYCERRRWPVDAELVERDSGTKSARPQWEQVMLLCRRRRVDAVVVVALDRIGRDLRHLVEVLDELAALQVALVSLREGVDATTPSGRALMSVAAVFAEFEKAVLAERVRAGMLRARRAGKRIGRPQVLLDLERALALRREGHSVRRIAAQLGVSKSTVSATLVAVRKGSAEPAA